MAVLTLRTVKGSPLTHLELDTNFENLDDEIHQSMSDIAALEADVIVLQNLAMVSGATPPATPIQGSMWFDTGTNSLYVWDGAKWVNTGETAPAGPAAPTGPNTAGDTWFDTATLTYKVYDGTAWINLGNVIHSGATYTGVLAAGTPWYDTTTKTLKVYDGTTWVDASSATYSGAAAPTSPNTGTLWFDTATETLKVYNGAIWTDSGETMPATNIAPTNASTGDLYYDTGLEIVMVYDGLVWKAAGAPAFSAVAPATPADGDQWFDSSTNTLFVWNGTEWVDVGTSTKFGTTALRPISGSTGDLYFNTTLGLLQLWDGANWVTAGAQKLDDLSDVDTTTNAPLTGQVLSYDGTEWVPSTPTIYSDPNAPASPVAGTLWFNTTTRSLMVYSGTAWLDAGATTTSGATGSTPAAAVSTAGDTFYDTTTKTLMVFNGTAWVSTSYDVEARATNPITRSDGSPLQDGDTYYNTANDVMMVFDSSLVPVWKPMTPKVINDLNDVDTATVPPTSGQTLLWDGTSQWKPGNIVAKSVPTTIPATPVAGDVYFDTVTRSLMVYDGANWLDAGSTTKAGATAARPAAGVSTVGDTYYNTTTGLLEVYNGTAWVTSGPQKLDELADVDTTGVTIGQVLTYDGTNWVEGDANDIRRLPNGTVNPANRSNGEALVEGDTYYNTSTNKLMVWDGAAWVVSDIYLSTVTFQAAGQNSTQVAGGTGGRLQFTLNDASVITTEMDGRYVRTVSGVAPDATTGNVPLSLTSVEVGDTAAYAAFQGTNPTQGTVYVITGDADPTQNGKAYIYNATTLTWYPVVGYDQAALDARYLNVNVDGLGELAGVDDTLAGTLNDFFVHDGTKWVAAKPSVDLLNDVDTTTVPPTSNQTLKWNGTNWVPSDIVAKSFPTVQPATPVLGDTYFNTTTRSLMVYDGANWLDTGSTTASGATGSEPSPATAGDQFFNTTTNKLMVHDGTNWVMAGAGALNDLTDVDTTGQAAGMALVYNGTNWVPKDLVPSGATGSEPSPVVAGDQFFNTTLGKLQVFDGTNWVSVGSVSAINDLSDVDTTTAPTAGQTLVWNGVDNWVPGNAGSSVTTGATGSEPASPTAGDMFYDTTTDTLMIWDGAAWVPAVKDIHADTFTWTAATGELKITLNDAGTTTDMVVDLDGRYAQTVNGVAPDASGNIAVSLTEVETGLDADRITTGGTLTNADEGLIWVVAGEVAPNDDKNGLTYIWDGAAWQAIVGYEQSSLDARYVLKSTSSINELADVDTVTTPPTNGQTLIWNGVDNWVPGTASTAIPTGPTGSEPASPVAGDMYYNTTLSVITVWNGSAWVPGATANNGTLTLQVGAAGATNTTVTVATGTGFSANTATNATYSVAVGPALTEVATELAAGKSATGILTVTGVDTLGQLADGTAGQVLSTNGAGTLSWIAAPGAPNLLPANATAPATRADGSALQDGDLYYDTTTNTLMVYEGGAWVAAGGSAIDARYQVAASAPATRADTSALVEGDLYYDTATDALMKWDGTSWTSVGTVVTVTYSNTAPTGTAVVGSEHYVTSDGTRTGTITQRFIYDTTGWTETPASGAKYIDELLDVDTTGKVGGESLLMWDATKVTGGVTGQWVVTSIIDASPTGGTTDDF